MAKLKMSKLCWILPAVSMIALGCSLIVLRPLSRTAANIQRTQTATGSDISAVSCNMAAIRDAVQSALDGDRVIVPAGDCTWNPETDGGPLLITKVISLIGAGDGADGAATPPPEDPSTQTIIRLAGSASPGDNNGYIEFQGQPAGSKFEISGFRFTGVSGSTSAADRAAIYINQHRTLAYPDQTVEVAILDNTFENIVRGDSQPGYGIEVYGRINGVIAQNWFHDSANEFISVRRSAYGEGSDGLSYREDGAQEWGYSSNALTTVPDPWNPPARGWGTSDFLFIEDNEFLLSFNESDPNQTRAEHAVTSVNGGKFVFRYNTVEVQQTSNRADGLVDGHGNWFNDHSHFAAEVYDNDITIDTGFGSSSFVRVINARGGFWLIHDNNIVNNSSLTPVAVELQQYRSWEPSGQPAAVPNCDVPGSYPCQTQTDYKQEQI